MSAPIFPSLGSSRRHGGGFNAQSKPLGCWLLDVRGKLIRGEVIDLLTALLASNGFQLDGSTDHQRHLEAGRVQSPTSDWARSHHRRQHKSK